MGRKARDVSTRQEISERVEKGNEDMREKASDLDKVAKDYETTVSTRESLDFGGTTEGGDEVEEAIRSAEDVTTDVFDNEDRELENIQGKQEEYEGEIQEKSDYTDSDLGKVSDASATIDTKETTSELLRAKDSLLRDRDFLEGAFNHSQEAREENERIQQELQARVRSDRG